ncbi:non-homologous end-joining factor 1 isoform X2 [Halictus rubicundus]|uniref:non-homologous end-joining factor 1 isoform X2 n=1 Tax=Halictus rubicundus TaxID=77578 RepID=UPI0040368C65
MTEKITSSQYTQERKWDYVKIDDNVYMFSVTQRNDGIEVLLTNLCEIWMETLSDVIILKRCKELNPLLNIDAFNYKDIVASILNNLHKHIDEASVEQIKLRIQLEGGSLKFILNLLKGTPQELWNLITKPLCISFMELNRQHKILLDLIKKKDVEIAEYRAQGVELTRQNIKTEVFREEQLKMHIPVPDMNMYINLLQDSEHFYNKLDLQKESVVHIGSTSEASNSGRMEEPEECSNVSKKDSLRVLYATSTKSKGRIQKDPTKKLNKGLKSFIS